ncbi:hypothetical protein J3998_12035 [Thiomicrorhabdus sp. 6S2-11]|uniref:Uncharacterized protein n=1 Tax=Thiomicrorhabdus marina TaxID=2818442 RepID=A0ABS3Q7H5_9GAMM|nr:hypothetical protein [Thiomicrorhabdus marina]MBO1928303.1 hypothetical protein [Thiomicrorhabdus marina]
MSFSAPIPEYASLAYLFNRWGIEPDEDYLFQLSEIDGLDFYYKHFNDGEFELYSADFNEPPLIKYELEQLQGTTPIDLARIGFTELVIERDYQYFKTDVGFAWGRVEITPFFNDGEKVYAFYENQEDEALLDLKYPYANYNEVFLSRDSVIKLESSKSLIKQPSTKIYITDLLQRWFTNEQLNRKEGTGSAFDLLEDYVNRLGLKLYIHNDELEPYWAFKDDPFQKQKPFFPSGEYLIKHTYGRFYGGDHFHIDVTTVCYSKDDSQEEILVLGNKGKYSKSIYAYADDIKEFEREHGIIQSSAATVADLQASPLTIEEQPKESNIDGHNDEKKNVVSKRQKHLLPLFFEMKKNEVTTKSKSDYAKAINSKLPFDMQVKDERTIRNDLNKLLEKDWHRSPNPRKIQQI